MLAALVVLLATGCAVIDRPSRSPVGDPAPDPVREALWIADGSGGLRAYDGRSDRPMATVEIGRSKQDWQLAGDGGIVWAYALDGRTVRVDTTNARVTARHQLPPIDRPGWPQMYYTHDTLWVLRRDGLWRVGQTGNPVMASLPAGFTIALVASGERWLWVTSTDGRLIRVDPVHGSATLVGGNPILRQATTLAEGPGGLLVAHPPTVTVLDPHTAAATWSVSLPADNTRVSLHPAVPQAWALTGTQAVPVRNPAARPMPAVTLHESAWTAPPATGFESLWIGDDLNIQMIRIPLTGGTPAEQIALPYDEDYEAADLVLNVHAGSQSIWIVDYDGFTGIMRLRPEDNRVTRIVEPNPDLTTAAIVADPPTAPTLDP